MLPILDSGFPMNSHILPMSPLIVEDRMKHHWIIRRRWVETPDAARRWDQVYQCLLRWEPETVLRPSLEPPSTVRSPQEVSHENCNLSARVHPTPSSDPDHRAAT